jgi:PKD repeat protein
MRRLRRLALLLVMSLCVLPASVGAQAPIYKPFEPSPGFVGYVEDELVVVFRPDARADLSVGSDAAGKLQVSLPGLQRTIELAGAQGLVREFPTAKPEAPGSGYPDLTGYYLVHLAPGKDLDQAVSLFEADPNVEHVEKIGLHAVEATPNDPYYDDPPPSFPHDQWHYWGTHGIDADLAWDVETGDGEVVVGILDSGVRYFHTDIGGNSAQWGPSAPFSGGNAWINPDEIPGNSIDDDGNGFVDDTIGWDFVASSSYCIDGDCSTADNDPDDYNGHGTHCAGTVGAITNNARSVAGIAGGYSNGTTGGLGDGVKILPCRIGWHAFYLGEETGLVSMAYAAQAMNYVAGLVDAGVNVAAVNCSWGSSNTGGLGAAVDALLARGVMVVHAAGNSNSSTADYLGNKAGVMNVAATDSLGAGASFTNYGTWVDVAAPGVDIMSTFRYPDDPDPTHHYVALMSGTSMSAPHICGIAALLESCNPALTGTEKFNLIVNNTTPYSDTRNLGSGIANAYLALDAAGCTSCEIAADFSADPTSGDAPLAVQFTDLSTGAETWTWYFGDDSTSALQNPMHTYENPDTYTVMLIVTNYCGADTLVRTGYIEVTEPPCEITADFSADPTSGEAPLAVQFTDLSTGAETWTWYFGDDSTSALQNPMHTYENPDTYTVMLVVTNYCGADTLVRTGYIEVTPTMTAIGDTPPVKETATWAYPNPFNPGTAVYFNLDRGGEVRIVVYDAAGRVVRNLVGGSYPAGIHRVDFDARDDGGRRLASGVYFYRLTAPGASITRKLVLLK